MSSKETAQLCLADCTGSSSPRRVHEGGRHSREAPTDDDSMSGDANLQPLEDCVSNAQHIAVTRV